MKVPWLKTRRHWVSVCATSQKRTKFTEYCTGICFHNRQMAFTLRDELLREIRISIYVPQPTLKMTIQQVRINQSSE